MAAHERSKGVICPGDAAWNGRLARTEEEHKTKGNWREELKENKKTTRRPKDGRREKRLEKRPFRERTPHPWRPKVGPELVAGAEWEKRRAGRSKSYGKGQKRVRECRGGTGKVCQGGKRGGTIKKNGEMPRLFSGPQNQEDNKGTEGGNNIARTG